MRVIIIFILCFSLNLNAQIAKDKYYHAGAGVVLSGSTYVISQNISREMNPIAPSLIAFTGACSKEFYDSLNGGRFSWQDAAFTTVSGVLTNYLIRKIWKPKKKKKIEYYVKF